MPTVVGVPPLYPDRPRTRGECVDGVRPCPWASCRYHLGDAPESCALDVADERPHTLTEVAAFITRKRGSGTSNLTKERIRQIETGALVKVKARLAARGFEAGDFARARDDGSDGDTDPDRWPTRADAVAAKVPGETRRVDFKNGGFAAERPSGVRLKMTKGE